jgi:hypothetical protein
VIVGWWNTIASINPCKLNSLTIYELEIIRSAT